MTDLRAICITERLYVVSVANEKGIAANDRRIPKKSIYEENDRKLGHSEKKLNLTQIELAKRIGVSRQTLMDIENQKRSMAWGIFMSLFGLFRENADISSLLVFYSISTDELTNFITNV